MTAVLVGVALVTATGSARADETASARRVWLEARPWTCSRELPAFARDVELACDALGACEVAASEAEATERATLRCEPGMRWRLGLAGVRAGEALDVTLTGDREQRLRRAAMWIARARLVIEPETPAAPPVTRTEPPEPTEPTELVQEVPAPVVLEAPARAVALPPDADTPKPRRKTPRHWVESHGGLAASAFTGVSNNAQGATGLSAAFAFPLPHGFYVGPGLTYAQFSKADWAGPWNWKDQTVGEGLLVGGTVGWGAPFDDSWVGVAVGVGGGSTWGPANAGAATGYGNVAVTVQVPFESWAVRPFARLSVTHLTNELGASAQIAALELGLAWRAF